MFHYGYENLKRIVATKKGKAVVDCCEREYHKLYSGKPISPLPYCDYKAIYINGDRDKYQKPYFERIVRLSHLQVLALVDDRYLEELEDILAAICDEFTWVLPAHNLKKDDTFDYTVIDLFSAERAMYLAETAYVFKDKLSKDIQNRILASLQSKIVDNFENRRFDWETWSHNWSAVCACGVGLAYLYQFPEKFPAIQDRIFTAMESYLMGVDDDGVVTEGIGYLEYGFGFFCLFFDVYTQLTGDTPAMLQNPKIRKILDFAIQARIEDGFFLPFADGGFKGYFYKAEIFYTIKNLFPREFVLPCVRYNATLKKALGFRVLHGVDRFGDGEDVLGQGMMYYPQSQLYINRQEKYSFVAKSGHNDEPHNHNDIGCFELIKSGEKIVSDLGAGRYTWAYHNDHTETGRYSQKIFVCGSWGHSVPIVDGRPQIRGKLHSGKVLAVTDDIFKVDMTDAYEDGLVDGLTVEYHLHKDAVFVNYACAGLKKNVVFRFVSECEPIVCEKGVRLGNAFLESASGILPTFQEILYEPHNLENGLARCYTVDFAVEKSGCVEELFKIKL